MLMAYKVYSAMCGRVMGLFTTAVAPTAQVRHP